MPASNVPMSVAQQRRLNKMFRLPGDAKFGDMLANALTQTIAVRLLGQAQATTTSNRGVFAAQFPLTIVNIKLTFEADDVAAGGQSHTWTFKKNNSGTVISKVSTGATLNKSDLNDAGVVTAVAGLFATGDLLTLDHITSATSGVSQSGIALVTFKANVPGSIA